MKKIRNTADDPAFERPLVTVDLVIFAVQEEALKVLLVRRSSDEQDPFPGRWALPGGFVDVKRDRSLQDCAVRKLKDKTGVSTPYLEQLGSWGDADRDPRGWSATHAYFALIQAPEWMPANPTTSADQAMESHWVAVDEASRKRLAFDHTQILATAVSRLRSKVEYTSLPAFLLAEPFTLPQLQRTYEVVLGRAMDKSAFRRRMLDADFLEEAGPTDGLQSRVAMGYRIKDRGQAMTFPRMFKSGE
jgi:8-oxo-dGTP diphosphatase